MLATLLLIILVPLGIFGYYHLLREIKDIDPALLNHQTSISETRKPNESAIYRSVDVPHGISVTRGLNLRSGYKIRDGVLKDIWYLGIAGQKPNSNQTRIVIGEKSFELGQINTILHLIADTLKVCSGNNNRVGLYGNLMESPELILVIWSCFFISDLALVFYNSSEDLSTELADAVSTIVTTSKFVSNILSGSFKDIVCVHLDKPVDHLSPLFTKFITIPENPVNDLKYEYNEHVDYVHANNNPYSIINKGQETKFFQLNFVSAVASRLMSTPTVQAWNGDDSLLISYDNESFSNTNIIFETCCGIMSNLKQIQIINPNKISSAKDLAKYDPTILCIDSHILKRICSNTKKTFLQSFILQRSEYFNSLGYFNRFGRIEKSLNIKIGYICQLSPILTSFICNFCKSVLGCRIIREFYTDFSIGPVLKTNLYDFRIVQNRNLALLGVPANSVELKTVFASEGETRSRLFARGMSIGKGTAINSIDEYWVDTGVDGTFATDGCFYGNV